MNREDIEFIGDGRFTFHIVGEAAHQHELDQMELFAGVEFPVFLKTEAANVKTGNRAVAVFAAFEIPLGYFPSEDCEQHFETIAAIEAAGKIPSCIGRIIGGPQKKAGYSYGLCLDFPDLGWQQLAGHMVGSSRKSELRPG